MGSVGSASCSSAFYDMMGTANIHVFPTLTSAQLARVATHGRVRPVAPGDVLAEAGEQAARFFVVTEGLIEVVRPVGTTGNPWPRLGRGSSPAK